MIRCVTDVRGLFSAITLLAMAWGAATAKAENLDKTGTLWAPVLEWSLENSSWSGNPFDLEATVTFTHADSGETRTTQMFYDEEDTWKFRLTATRTGTWTFITASDDADLDGRQGTVTVQPNPDPQARGFLVAHGNKYAWQAGQDGEVEAMVPNIYMNLEDFGVAQQCGWTAVSPTFSDPAVFAAYLDEAEDHGCNGVFALMGNQWFQAQTVRWDQHNSQNPDPVTFQAMERAIMDAHSRGMFLHIWVWGDEDRRWTQIGVGGINGIPDRRLQRYKSARLGPLPGWTMSYAFDLQEWVSPAQVASWADYLLNNSGWDMLLSARQEGGFTSPTTLPVAAYDDRLTHSFYHFARQRLVQTPIRPVIFERRFAYLRDGVWTMDTTRRAFWQFAMAGGVAAIWGHYPAVDCSVPWQGYYPNPTQLRTHRQFWQGRLLADMEPDNDITNGLCLRTPDRTRYIFYREATDSIWMNLSNMPVATSAVAVDAAQPYNEISLGVLQPGSHNWTAPYTSDWAIAVGVFAGRTDCDFAVNPPPAIGESHAYRNLPADPQSFAYQLINVTAGEAAYAVETTDVEGNPVSYSWLELDTSGGTIPEGETETAAATITNTDLPAGTYTAYLRFTDLNADCDPVVHRIDLTIIDCLMQVDHEDGAYRIINTEEPPEPIVFTVTNAGVGSLNYTVQKVGVCDWLTLDKSGGGPLPELGGTDQVTAVIDPTDLSDGLHGCTLRFVDSCAPSVELLRTVQVSVRQEGYQPYWVADFSDWSGSDGSAVASYTDTDGLNPNSFTVTYIQASGTGWLTQGTWGDGKTAKFLQPAGGGSGRARFGTDLPDAMNIDTNGKSFAWRARYGDYSMTRGPVQLQVRSVDNQTHRPYFRVQNGTTMHILNNSGGTWANITGITLPFNVAVPQDYHDWSVSVVLDETTPSRMHWKVWLTRAGETTPHLLLFGGSNGQHTYQGETYSFQTNWSEDSSTTATPEFRLGEMNSQNVWDFEFDCVAYRPDSNNGQPLVCETWQPPPPPTITGHPSDQSKSVGETATFGVTAEYADYYQWQVNDGSGWTDIDAATDPEYTTPTLTADDNGNQYRCVVSNASGSAESDPATLTVNPSLYAIADFDQDGNVDLEDFGLLQRCYGASPLSGDCVAEDLNDDGLVNQADFEILRACLSGAGVPADPMCGIIGG